ncbi:MAG: hypothetical protein CVT49_04695 [candidate division Zixibacteria bacterium HGW-Zixibacteria-1]|nr:MAG: hypothetical protein CVT49_04695 [candidate division Zixibacteria bacterium HGW-Zixibacteria-1]
MPKSVIKAMTGFKSTRGIKVWVGRNPSYLAVLEAFWLSGLKAGVLPNSLDIPHDWLQHRRNQKI